ncbi:DUF6298 domain-containing protein [Mariniflexile soesokkakense]|uniref:DUF6298 domain-containing protein n=1 Tax=Mariniflexile soesokkakense TaxID=1343160 RepID=A0ABV0A8I1_9FLAO
MNFISIKNIVFHQKDKLILSSVALFFIVNIGFSQSKFPDIVKNKKGGVAHVADSLGNQIPDFSYAGYMASEKAIPYVDAKIFVPNQTKDATQKIQAAIDYVGNLKPNSAGIRGAVLLDKGTFKISGSLYIKSSGVVLRGSGNAENETILLGTGIEREAIIRVLGVDNKKHKDTLDFKTPFTPLGTTKIQLKNTSKLKVSDEIIIQKPLTDKWIKALDMEEFGGETGWIGWKTRDWDITWNRVITNINGNEVTINAPLTMALDDNYGTTSVITYIWQGRIENIGIENLVMQSTFDASNLKDELHRWLGISMENVRNAWVRQVNFKHFAGGAVSVLKSAQQITVEDCMASEPISEIAAFRRHTFYTEGQQTLFQRCYSENGYHDFAVGGFGTTGPNAFVQCESFMPYSNSGAIGSWATGVLFDVTYIDGEALSYNNREQAGRGAGWTAANSVIWETSASKIDCYSPPTAQNWAFGVWGGIMVGNGQWKDVNNHITPRSLFYAQLENRLEKLPMNPYVFDTGSEPTSSPSVEQAQELTKGALNPIISLPEWIQQVSKQNMIPVNTSKLKSVEDLKLNTFCETSAERSRSGENKNTSRVEINNGKLTFNGKLLVGQQRNVMWWRGSLRDHDVENASAHITRFVPGRIGKGFTDNLTEVVTAFNKDNVVALEHNYGLWYDRRMDDHERTRRIDADVWPPFYEQPFARTGKGLAWDHLSTYDLTKYNDWYWYRLARFADLAEPNGQLLINQQYFQHNIIEAGAHWSSSPWRSANNVNGTEFPEPPPYAGDKRIFMAEQFYDISNETRKKLHQQFIRKSLENFQGNSNVIQLTSAEYTGPLHFMEFWLDEGQKWKDETGKNGIIGLSATKDVQDAILKDTERAKTVDLIDIRYWHYREDGTAYAPEGGKNLAPRQHARNMKVGKETEAQVYRAVREYREAYPEKVMLYSTNASPRFGWAVLMAGGSLPNVPSINVDGFYESLSKMKANSDENYNSKSWSLQDEGESYLFYLKNTKTVEVDLSFFKGQFEVFWIGAETGTIIVQNSIQGKQKHSISVPKSIKENVVVYIKKK